MINNILGMIFKNTLYIKFSSKNISIRYVEKQTTIEEEPIIAIRNEIKSKKIIAVGIDSKRAQFKDPVNVTIHNAFKHPRTFLSNFEIAEATLRYFVYKIVQRNFLVKPIIIFHPTENIEGGVTQIERRGLRELGISVGARETYVWTGRLLTDGELTDKHFLKMIEK